MCAYNVIDSQAVCKKQCDTVGCIIGDEQIINKLSEVLKFVVGQQIVYSDKI